MALLIDAIALAARAHDGQLDKAGAPYILHPLRVMLAQETDEARMAAVLHDVVEDTGWTLATLAEQGFPPAVLAAVDALTRHPDESYEEYVARAGANPVARAVKLADLKDDLDLRRLPEPTEADWARLARCRRAWWALTEGRPPEVAGLTWGTLAAEDALAVQALQDACGERTVPVIGPVMAAATLAARDESGRLVACAWARVHRSEKNGLWAGLDGMVHPHWRRCGLGSYLLLWAEMQAWQARQAPTAGQPVRLGLHVQNPSADAETLYRRHGFRIRFAEDELSRSLTGHLAASELPAELELVYWSKERVTLFHRAYCDAFSTIPRLSVWPEKAWLWETPIDDSRPELSLLLKRGDEPVGYVVAELDHGFGHIAELGVHPAWRRRGLATALLTRVMLNLRAAGQTEVRLEIPFDNPRAQSLCAKLGFVLVNRDIDYEQELADRWPGDDQWEGMG